MSRVEKCTILRLGPLNATCILGLDTLTLKFRPSAPGLTTKLDTEHKIKET